MVEIPLAGLGPLGEWRVSSPTPLHHVPKSHNPRQAPTWTSISSPCGALQWLCQPSC